MIQPTLFEKRSKVEHLRKRAGGLAIRGFFEGAARLAKRHPRAHPSNYGVEIIKDIPYRNTGKKQHLLDIYRPKTPGPHPVVMYVHGGGFRILSKDTHWLMGLMFASRGYIVLNVNYHLAPQHVFPKAVEDVSHAFAWMVEHIHRFGGDLETLILAGESAGANLVTGLTISSCYERQEPWARRVWQTSIKPKATLPYCGFLQVSEPERFEQRRPLPAFLNDRIHEVSRGYLEGSPCQGREFDWADVVNFFERGEQPDCPLPPFFLPVGTKDPVLDDTRRLHRALEKMNVPAIDRYYVGGVHAFQAFIWQDIAKQCWRDTFSFLDEHDLLPEQ